METIKLGIIGAGNVVREYHLPDFLKVKDVKIEALCDVDIKKAKKLVKLYKLNTTKVFSDYKNLIELDLDAVSIATPNYLHCKMAIDALNSGKDVLVEKPMAISMREADRMISTSQKNKRILMVNQKSRFTPETEAIRKIIRDGTLGNILNIGMVTSHKGPNAKWFFQKKYSGGGCTIDLGIHAVDSIRYTVNTEAKEVVCFAFTMRKNIDVEDNSFLIIKFNDNTFATVESSWCRNPGEYSIIINCEKGSLRIGPYTGYKIIMGRNKSRMSRVLNIPAKSKYGNLYEYFIKCIRTREKPITSGEVVQKSLEIVLAAIKSARTGKIIRLPTGR